MNIITRKDAAKLPIKSVIREHSLDRYKYPQTLDLTKLKDGGWYYREYTGHYRPYKLRSFRADDPYRFYELIKEGDDSFEKRAEN